MYSLKVLENNFQEALGEIPTANETYAYSALAIEYEQEYFQNKFIPQGILFFKQKFLLGIMIFTREETGDVSFFKKPIKVFWKKEATRDDRYEFYQMLFNFLDKKMESKEFNKIKFDFDTSLFSEYQKYSPVVSNFYESFIDLESSESVIKRGIRKSYRSLVSWGNREMQFVRLDHANANEELFEEFRLFHIEISGRETRSKKSWDIQFEMIKKGKAFLDLGYYQDQLVSGILILLGETEAFYGVAVNNRTLMADKKPIGHAIMFRSILHVKELGIKIYNLGYTGPSFANEKEAEIGKFKKGLASEMRSHTSFEIGLEKV